MYDVRILYENVYLSKRWQYKCIHTCVYSKNRSKSGSPICIVVVRSSQPYSSSWGYGNDFFFLQIFNTIFEYRHSEFIINIYFPVKKTQYHNDILDLYRIWINALFIWPIYISYMWNISSATYHIQRIIFYSLTCYFCMFLNSKRNNFTSAVLKFKLLLNVKFGMN